MKRTIPFLSALVFLVATTAFTGCSSDEGPITSANTSATSDGNATLMKVGRTHIWAGCDLYRTVATPATFNPQSTAFDELYNIGPAGGSFKDGYVLISDAYPGGANYNGGRWHLNVLKSGVDPTKYANACSVDDLDLDDFMSAGAYFECPLLPLRGNNP